jgi:uncharacterized protein (DUF305 family)
MIPHHRQALVMTALVEERALDRRVRLLAGRIEVSQNDEIAWMEQWLRDNAPEAAADEHAHHAGHEALMPGMLTPAEIEALAATSGAAFDRLFLESMIRHHEGALVMVDSLFASPGGAQQPDVYRIATDIGADQAADIDRMRAMLSALRPSAEH